MTSHQPKLQALQVDSMSEAIENAEVMLSCISVAYKESASEYARAPRPLYACQLHCLLCSHAVFPGVSRLPVGTTILSSATSGDDPTDDGEGLQPNRLAYVSVLLRPYLVLRFSNAILMPRTWNRFACSG
eukprot:COSAG05_NODE_12257_length_475_cov_0.789894_1_plen_129_part_10